VALVAPPSDQVAGMDTKFRSSEQHVLDISTVINYLRERYERDVYLHGHCRSSFSPANVATELKNHGIAGIILSSPRSRGRHGAVTDYEEGVVKVPILLVQHRNDACKGTLYRYLNDVKRFYEKSSSRVDVIIVSGGETGSTGPSSCQNKAHSFVSFRKETAQAIADWVKGNTFPDSIPD